MEALPGKPYPLGATWDGEGVNFALFSSRAERVELCLFDPQGKREVERVTLREQTNQVWHAYLPSARPGLLYGYRVSGPYAPQQGNRFNPNKLLLDPYAKDIVGQIRWSDAHFGYRIGHKNADLSFDRRDSAFGMPKCRVVDPAFTWGDDRPPRTPWPDTIIYEVHVKGLSFLHPDVPQPLRGTYAGLASAPIVEHLQRLGVTAVELLPIHAIVDDRRLIEKGLRNYWGYNSIGYFAPDARYAASGSIKEFKTMVKTLHAAGIEVILDVVYNHTGEGDALGPTLCFRGIDNAAYYRLAANDLRRYVDYTGTGNTLNMTHPQVMQMMMDSLRYWVLDMHVDGFRFDLAPTLARDVDAVDRVGTFFAVVQQDPVLSQVKLIAEPWDLGEGGYQLGQFPVGWSEWNDQYRDAVRAYWKGDDGLIGNLASRITGSSDLYAAVGRRPYASVNFITAHDGFTLRDLVSYDGKHNEANGENNRDGTDKNVSWNCGIEGPTDDANVNALRERQMRNFLATLLLSQGIPMLLGGDPVGHTQGGNNNAYCQDNELGWINWGLAPSQASLLAFTRKLIGLRKRHPLFRRRSFFQGADVNGTKVKDIVWLTPDGREMKDEEWQQSFARCLGVHLSGVGLTETDARGGSLSDGDFLWLLNSHHESIPFVLPALHETTQWRVLIDTRYEQEPPAELCATGSAYPLDGRSLVLLQAADETHT